MARTPKRLSGPAQVAATAATKYTTPSYIPNTLTTVVRHIHIFNPSGSAVTFTMSIGTDGATTRIFDAYSIAANSVLDHFCYYPLTTGEIIQAGAGTTNVLLLTVNGDENV